MVQNLIVLCHTIFNDAFRNYPNVSEDKKLEQESAKFIFRYLIETRDSNNQKIVAVTSEQVMFGLEYSLPNQGIGTYPAQIILALRNLMYQVNGKVSNLGESITIISDILASKIDKVILVSNMPSKVLKVVEYYQKYEPTSRRIGRGDIPFNILSAMEIEEIIRELDPDTCEKIDKRLE